MSDETDPGAGGGTPPEGTPPPEPDPPESGDPGDEPGLAAEVAKWKALARKHEVRAKQGAAAEKRLAELDEANKTELEKATARAAEAESRASEAEMRAMRAEVAARKGLTAGQAKRLQGETEEELEADADELVAAFKPSEEGSSPNGGGSRQGTPTPRLRPGAVPHAGAVETDPAKLAAQISRRSF
jgi:hypothetical protein